MWVGRMVVWQNALRLWAVVAGVVAVEPLARVWRSLQTWSQQQYNFLRVAVRLVETLKDVIE